MFSTLENPKPIATEGLSDEVIAALAQIFGPLAKGDFEDRSKQTKQPADKGHQA
jgi:hypothetical protein